MTITLTAPIITRTLTAPEIRPAGALTLIVNADDTRITRTSNRRVTRGGNVRVAHNTTYGYPTELTAKVTDRTLTAPEIRI